MSTVKTNAIVLTGGVVARVDEASLIRAAQRRNQEAFAALVRAHDQNVLRLAGVYCEPQLWDAR